MKRMPVPLLGCGPQRSNGNLLSMGPGSQEDRCQVSVAQLKQRRPAAEGRVGIGHEGEPRPGVVLAQGSQNLFDAGQDPARCELPAGIEMAGAANIQARQAAGLAARPLPVRQLPPIIQLRASRRLGRREN